MNGELRWNVAFITLSKGFIRPANNVLFKRFVCDNWKPRFRTVSANLSPTYPERPERRSGNTNIIQIKATLPESFKLYFDSKQKVAVVSCRNQAQFSRSHADTILTEIRRLQATKSIQSFLISVPSSTHVSRSTRGFIRDEGGEIVSQAEGPDFFHLLQESVQYSEQPIAKAVISSSKQPALKEPADNIAEMNHLDQDTFRNSFLAPNDLTHGEDIITPLSSSKKGYTNENTRTVSSSKPKIHGPRHSTTFVLSADHKPAGDQPVAIEHLTDGLMKKKRKFQVLHGVTGSGKTFIMGNIIAQANRPTLVLAPNKTLAAQLYNEFSRLFPNNRVEYFVSHFKHYQPEAYLPASDRYIAKSSSVDKEIDRLRHAATRSLFERNDTIVVASVSSIYGLGLPSEYLDASIRITAGGHLDEGHAGLITKIKEIGYVQDAKKVSEQRGFFNANDQYLDLSPPWEVEGTIYRIFWTESTVKGIEKINMKSGSNQPLGFEVVLYPARHFVTPKHRLEVAIQKIEKETNDQVQKFQAEGKLLEATRLAEKVTSDIDMMRKVGYCGGAENYSLYLSGRDEQIPIAPPETLLDYMPKDGRWLLFIDESHVTVPQLGAMYSGNAARKRSLIRHGFRLPSSIENRPLSFKEFWGKASQTIFVSATPGIFETEKCDTNGMVEAVIRPTGIVDPTIDVISTKGQIEHLTCALAKVVRDGGKAIVTTITKKFAEDVAECLSTKPPVDGILDRKLEVAYLHSGIDSVGRMQILEAMRAENRDDEQDEKIEGSKSLDVVVGVNLLREGIDLPAVRLVAILDADSEGFLRGETALIQMIGRAARNIDGHVIMYGDTMTQGMQRAIAETNRRRRLQTAYNSLHGVSPTTVGVRQLQKKTEKQDPLLDRIRQMKLSGDGTVVEQAKSTTNEIRIRRVFVDSRKDAVEDEASIRERMLQAAQNLDFETASLLRDKLQGIR